MAKRGTLDHPKTLSLARALRVEAWSALGLLEALWHWAGRYRPTGNITGVTPRDLADGIRARRNPQKLLNALIQERWIDQVGDCLYVHDWPDHADDATKKSLIRSGKKFDPYYETVSPLKGGTESGHCRDTVETESASRAHAQGGKAGQGSGSYGEGEVQEGESGTKLLCISDGFPEFRAAAEQYGISGSEPDWQEARQFEWGKLDFHQKLAAVRGLAERIQQQAIDDPARKALPKNYLRRRMWEREVRGIGPPSRSDATSVELDKVLKREAVKANALTIHS